MARKKQISISDVAKAQGISITTVSFILNGKAKERRISDALNKRVLDYVKKIGYKPSQLVRKPAGEAKVLALLLEDIADPFFLEVTKQVERIAGEVGYQVLFFDTGSDLNKTRQHIQLCIDKEVDGVIVIPPEGFEEIAGKMKERIPMVLFDRFLPAIDMHYVVSDNRQGAYEATKYLLEKVGKRIGLVSLYSSQTHIRGRLDGYMDAMDEFRTPSFIRKLSAESPDEEKGEQIVEFIIDNKLDAVLFAAQYLAVSGFCAIRKKGLAMPMFVTFDKHILFEGNNLTDTAVLQHVEQLAQKLVETLIDEIGGKLKEVRQLVIPCKLRTSGSVIASTPEQIS